MDPSLIYVAVTTKGEGIRVIVFAGNEASNRIKAGMLAKEISVQLGGSGGGGKRFGQEVAVSSLKRKLEMP